MKRLSVVVYTMKGCPYCSQLKEMLIEQNIEFYDRDIHEYHEEYGMYCEATKCDLIPALMIIESDGDKHDSFLYAPDQHYHHLDEAVSLIKEHVSKLDIM
jgi:glutaredoxin